MKKTLLTLSLSLIFGAVFTAPLLAKAPPPPVPIDPTVSAIANIREISSPVKFWVGEFDGGPASDEPVGHTRTGRKKLSPIVCSPVIAEALSGTLVRALEAQGVMAESEEAADYVITGSVIDFKMVETSRFLHQIMAAELRVDVTVVGNVEGRRVQSFYKLRSSGERTAFDTTKRAEAVARVAVEEAMRELLNSLAAL